STPSPPFHPSLLSPPNSRIPARSPLDCHRDLRPSRPYVILHPVHRPLDTVIFHMLPARAPSTRFPPFDKPLAVWEKRYAVW
ncbi:hypothetical protein COCCADRAFT_109556, partial [Bipolaris zeicola 26-R-13]